MELVALEQIEAVVAEPLRFKGRLGIGEDAYATLRHAKTVRAYWDLLGAVGGGAAVVKAAALGLGAASTPLGWVLAGAALSGGAWYGIQRALNNATQSRVTVIPKCINTPIDALALSLFDLLAPLALKLAAPDGHPKQAALRCLTRYLVDDWGYDARFVRSGLAHLRPQLAQIDGSELGTQLATFMKASPDCNYALMSQDLLAFLRQLLLLEGPLDAAAEQALAAVRAEFEEVGRSAWSKLAQQATARAERGALQLGAGALQLGAKAVVKGQEVAAAVAASGVLERAREQGSLVAQRAKEKLQHGLVAAAQRIQERKKRTP